jgi:hypothetical protein
MRRLLITIAAVAFLLLGWAVAFEANATIGAGLAGSADLTVRCMRRLVMARDCFAGRAPHCDASRFAPASPALSK